MTRPRIRKLLSWLGISFPALNEQELLLYLDELDSPADEAAPARV